MTNGLRLATLDDLDWMNRLCNQHRQELGFVPRVVLTAGISSKEIIVVPRAAICHFHLRRDGWITIYTLISQISGDGKRLLKNILTRGPVRLKCPVNLAANGFYRHLGGRLVRQEAPRSSRRRTLNVWEWNQANA